MNHRRDWARLAGRSLPLALLATAACPEQAPGPAGEVVTAIQLTVSGGPNAGRYEVSSGEVACARGIVGLDSWATQFADRGQHGRLGSLQLVVPDAHPPGRATRAFYLGLVFGSLFDGADHEIETRVGALHPRGAGMVSVSESDGVTMLTVSGHTADDVWIAATIRCHRLREVERPVERAPPIGTDGVIDLPFPDEPGERLPDAEARADTAGGAGAAVTTPL
ncbi:MAG TPA: hypothetical protein VNK43_11050 [Gemmatimonadales bacterium]|nr:hypothetical protein [Gemmatimonadales bacterium]